jgi:hypothetical protein
VERDETGIRTRHTTWLLASRPNAKTQALSLVIIMLRTRHGHISDMWATRDDAIVPIRRVPRVAVSTQSHILTQQTKTAPVMCVHYEADMIVA